MGFTQAIQSCCGKWVTFSGRASRSEFWWFRLFYLLCFVSGFALLAGINLMLGIKDGSPEANVTGGLFLLAMLGLLMADFALVVRRLHDTDHSGWCFWIALVLVLGEIILLLWFCTRGTEGPNRFGDDPLAGEREEAAL